MSLRTIPYGYEIKNGQAVVNEDEAAVVRYIYITYINGKTLKDIADILTNRDITYYQQSKVWNKNMVSRIIENSHYLGDEIYPTIVTRNDFQLANERKSGNGGRKAELPKITVLVKNKMVCEVCNKNLRRINKWCTREKWLCPNGCKCDIYLDDKLIFSTLLEIFNQVIVNPELLRIKNEESVFSPTAEIIRQTNDIYRLMEQPSIEFHMIAKLIMDCASVKFNCCQYERSGAVTEALISEYEAFSTLHDLDYGLIEKTVDKITANLNGSITVRFLNYVELSNRMKGEI